MKKRRKTVFRMTCPKNYNWNQFKTICVPTISTVLDVQENVKHHRVIACVWSGLCLYKEGVGCPYYKDVNRLDNSVTETAEEMLSIWKVLLSIEYSEFLVKIRDPLFWKEAPENNA